MRYVELVQGGEFSVPVIGLGTYHLLDRMAETEAKDVIHAAQKVGIDFVDTSDNYMNEDLIGEAIAESDAPEQFYVATKTGLATTYAEFVAMRKEGRSANTSPARIKEQVVKSAIAIGRSSIDLYQLHAYDEQTSAEDIAITMSELIDSNHIRMYGVSNYSREELEQLLEACDSFGLPRPTTIQPYFNLLSTHVYDQGIDVARKEGLTVLAHSPLMKGFLSDKFVCSFDSMLRRVRDNGRHEVDVIDQLQRANDEVKRLRDYANNNGYTLSEYALAWLINQPATVAINACVRPEHLESSLRASDWMLDREGMELAEEVRNNPDVKASAPRMMATANGLKPYYAKRQN